ncbi:DUF2520 domain-containing protein [Arenibacter sp. GZD96]|uniref:Rossmann-like and DUF2520 domain-containing protein n=1 Tax=Aurantibrevibacter litoralis TaxID=3106030 RepID=UPI002AFF5B60|nr:DUF2520 domain-containing protein [Arenibacter sp. GZD-96]MEA1786198.1 DUF2520 domain-containing protein [Arenibacter sp. GZD-96]
MITVVLLGGGNLALHLFDALQKSKECSVLQYYNRSIEKIAHLSGAVSITNNLQEIVSADLYIVAVSDDAIAKVAKNITKHNALIAHTSGSAPLAVLPPHSRKASFYLLQTFTKGRALDFQSVPICLETEDEADFTLLKRLAMSLSRSVHHISTPQRQALHLAAVFVNNFTNHLYLIGQEICVAQGLSFDLLRPLIMETAKKIESLSPFEAQTGPAKRGDTKTLQRHQRQLQQKNRKEMYILLSQSIENTHGKKL